MNDFTKKELLALEDAMQNMLEIHKPQDGISPLLNKLQSMIDNYCKHTERVSSSDESGHMVVQCGRCDFVLWHEKN